MVLVARGVIAQLCSDAVVPVHPDTDRVGLVDGPVRPHRASIDGEVTGLLVDSVVTAHVRLDSTYDLKPVALLTWELEMRRTSCHTNGGFGRLRDTGNSNQDHAALVLADDLLGGKEVGTTLANLVSAGSADVPTAGAAISEAATVVPAMMAVVRVRISTRIRVSVCWRQL